jgi:hypothetical protein
MVKALPHVLNVALAHQVFGQVLFLTNRTAYGIAECDRALALDRNLAGAHALIGKAKSLMGRGEETEAHINEALRLCPHHQFTHYMLLIVGAAKLRLSADAEAVDWYDAASKPTALIRSRILYSPLHWRCSAHWMRRRPLQGRDLRSIQALLFVATAMTRRVITRLTSPHRSASIKECGWPGHQRSDVGAGSFASVWRTTATSGLPW